MSENEPTAGTPAEPAAPAASAQETDWKVEARKWEARAKENNRAAEELRKIEDSKKSEIERIQERATTAEQRAAQLEQERTRLSVIAAEGIPADYHDLVVGSDEESLKASAAKVKRLIGAAATQEANSASYVIPSEGNSPNLALNSDALEESLRRALGIGQ
ncbi:DUF4355 domain-containing protein [Arthrobacter sp. IA7]|uniref:capsid assembly scaffolding protein Gp46 family protein n=1 Tax=Arthrobacter ipis TaxID=2716202 RepID=UPI001682131E|nr:DUF4355 domain-containing protein [Arthrobacter ipis]MBD1541028.1 DUF4355 domain-containing protein [Arthrobacter ipis]